MSQPIWELQQERLTSNNAKWQEVAKERAKWNMNSIPELLLIITITDIGISSIRTNKLFDSRRDGTEALVCSFFTGIRIFALSSSFIYLILFSLILFLEVVMGNMVSSRGKCSQGRQLEFSSCTCPPSRNLMSYLSIPVTMALTSLIRSFPHTQLQSGEQITDIG